MTDKERAIIMAYTGTCMLEGERLDAFYQYLAELYGRPVYTHEWLTLDIKEKSRPDFIRLCEEEQPERKKGKWVDYSSEGFVECPFCHSATNCDDNKGELHYCFSCGAELRGEQDERYHEKCR